MPPERCHSVRFNKGSYQHKSKRPAVIEKKRALPVFCGHFPFHHHHQQQQHNNQQKPREVTRYSLRVLPTPDLRRGYIALLTDLSALGFFR